MPICCEIVTQDKIVYDGEADLVTVPGINGVMGILPRHSPLLSLLKPGVITIKIRGKQLFFSVNGGIVEVQPDQVTVLTDDADDAKDIDLDATEIETSKIDGLIEQTAKTETSTIQTLFKMKHYLEVKINAAKKYQSGASE